MGCKNRVNVNQGTFFADDKVNVNDNDEVEVNENVNVKDNFNVNDNIDNKDNVNGNGNGNDSNNDNDNDNGNTIDNVNDNVNLNDNVNVIDNDNDNDIDETVYRRSKYNQGSSYNQRNILYPQSSYDARSGFTYLQSSFPDLQSNFTDLRISHNQGDISPLRINNINEDLQSWLDDENMIIEATLPENFRCIISGPSECGKTFLLIRLVMAGIYFDKVYILSPTGNQYEGVERINDKADFEFIIDIKDLPSPDKLPKDLKN